jgi:hypothetical protein
MTNEEKKMVMEKRSVSLKKTMGTPEYRARRAEITRKIWARPGYREMMSKKFVGRKITWGKKMSESARQWHQTHTRTTSDETKKKLSEASKGKELTKVTEEIERRVVELYKRCGSRKMSLVLADEGKDVSPYLIRRILRKANVYQKWRKMRPELA